MPHEEFDKLKTALYRAQEFAAWVAKEGLDKPETTQSRKVIKKFRTGNHNPRNVYLEGLSRDTDTHIGVFFDPEMAKYVVEVLNGESPSDTGDCPACHHPSQEHDFAGCNSHNNTCGCLVPRGAHGV
jgi:hypothetical protein